jgi:hypothetical protein
MGADESERIQWLWRFEAGQSSKTRGFEWKVLVRMTAGGKRMYVVLTGHGIAARGETPVLPVYGW